MITRQMRKVLISMAVLVLIVLYAERAAHAISIDPAFSPTYSFTDLGQVPGLPDPYGGLTFMAGDPNTILIGGDANTASGKLYSIGVTRDAGNHVTGFTGAATVFADAAYNDGGVTYGPGGVLFLSRWPTVEIGQIKPGSAVTDKIVDLTTLGLSGAGSPGGLTFVPSGFPGAGQLKMALYDTGEWYTLSIAPDGGGTFDITGATLETTIVGGPEGMVYVPTGSPLFPNPTLLVAEWDDGNIAAYDLDANGNPIPGTRSVFMSGLSGAEGAVIDPLTGDFLFSTFGATGGDHVIAVQGFVPPQPPGAVPEPATVALLGIGLAGLAGAEVRRRRKKKAVDKS